MLKILGIIPARGGSKGVKNKNLKIINKKPLLYYTIKRAKQSNKITHLIGSTENKNIKKFFLNSDVSVPL
jgi:CMP-N-acetylneuraminic acid synthetase